MSIAMTEYQGHLSDMEESKNDILEDQEWGEGGQIR
jgi:hypothetical protein